MVERNQRFFQVRPHIPEQLQALEEIALNFWWCWHYDAIELFQGIDIELWHELDHSPYRLLSELGPDRLNELAEDEGFLQKMGAIYLELQDYMNAKTWYKRQYADADKHLIAYFSAEFGIHESLPNYSGGLGILAGDHLKSASDLGLPLVAVGLMYKRGYFNQYLNEDGWQQEEYPPLDFFSLPIKQVLDDNGEAIKVDIDFPGRKILAQVWKVIVGRVNLFLLDTNIPENSDYDRNITDILYGGDTEHRIQQEMVLGVGGMRALKKMGYFPSVVHMNEGHSAFSALERVRAFIEEDNLSYIQAREAVKTSTVFTTHTPVPAGNEVFPDHLISQYLEPYIKSFGIPLEDFLDLGRIHQHDSGENFGMTVFSIRNSKFANGVSRLHGRVAREMWHQIWENLYPAEAPVDYVTNGIHLPSWISDEMERLYRRYIGPSWMLHADDHEIWKRVNDIPANELWRALERLQERMVTYIRISEKRRLKKQHASPQEIKETDDLLDPEALTIGFARRFATYKRATLLFRDKDRLRRILHDKTRPVQFIFAGKAHPRDMEGKKFIKEIVHFAREEGIKNKVIFLENYNIKMARYLVQGVDVWLNNPRRPHEASGTSGMKVPPNGGLNLSVLDGWWAEGYSPEIGWAIGGGEEYDDHEYQDYVEGRALFDLLEKVVIPLYFNRDVGNVPNRWVDMVKGSIARCTPTFHTDRMVKEYTEKFYIETSHSYLSMVNDKYSELSKYVKWFESMQKKWPGVAVESFGHNENQNIAAAGDNIYIEAVLNLNGLKAEEVDVKLLYAKEGHDYYNEKQNSIDMEFLREEKGKSVFTAAIDPVKAGAYAYSVRVVPYHRNMVRKLEPGYIKWG